MIVALVLSVQGLRQPHGRGFAIAGLWISVTPLALFVLLVLLNILCP